MGKTLFEKIWDKHLIASIDESTNLIFIDLHLVHEVTSCLLYTSPSPRDATLSRMPSSA